MTPELDAEETRTPAVLTAELAPESAQMRLLRSFCQRSEHTEALREPVFQFSAVPEPDLALPGGENRKTGGVLTDSGIYNSKRLKMSFMPNEKGTFVGSHVFTFDRSGIHSAGYGYKSFHDWCVVKSVLRDNGMVMLFIDTAHAFIFPENQISDVDNFTKSIEQFMA